MDINFRKALDDICSGDTPAAIVTVISVKGSTPRKPGTKMIVTPDGNIMGTIGGGCSEAEVRREALNALAAMTPVRFTVNMTNDAAGEDGMVCGGTMEVFIDILPGGKNSERLFLARYLKSLEVRNDTVLITMTGPEGNDDVKPGSKMFVTSKGTYSSSRNAVKISPQIMALVDTARSSSKPSFIKEASLFIEPHVKQNKVLILGCGHISLPLCTMAKLVGYHVTVVDDRPDFANKARFSTADIVICDDFVHALKKIPINSDTSVVIVTRGHKHDWRCLLEVINKPAAYIGMIGSRRRVRLLLDELASQGIPSETIQNIHAPIGLAIGAETPEEIAVSILSELISVHRNGSPAKTKLQTNVDSIEQG